MKSYNTKIDFIRYWKQMWFTLTNMKKFLVMLEDFTASSIANDQEFIIRWLVSFKIENTTTTLKPWKVFKKVKAYPAINILKLSRKKC